MRRSAADVAFAGGGAASKNPGRAVSFQYYITYSTNVGTNVGTDVGTNLLVLYILTHATIELNHA